MLNDVISDVVVMNLLFMDKGKWLKIFYII